MTLRLPTTAAVAWRNLWRNGRRTALALAAIGLSVTLVLAYNGMARAYSAWVLDAITGPMIGHVQVHAPVWRDDRSMDRTIPRVASVLDELARTPGVVDVSARVYAPALAAVGDEGTGVVVIGLDPAVESGNNRLLPAGQSLAVGEALVGRALAEAMGVRPGQVLALVGQGVDGSLADALVTTRAVVDTAVDLVNRHGVLIRLDEAQALFAMPGEAHEVIVHLQPRSDAQATAQQLGGRAALAGLEVLDWRRIAPELVTILGILDAVGLFALLLVFVAAAAGVANTMLMATFERTHEFGMLLALGAGPLRIVRMIVAESIALGVVGSIVGAVLGVTLVLVTGRTGVDFARLTGGGPSEVSALGMRMSMVFYPRVTAADVWLVVAAVLATSLIASLWPAARAARLEPARALRE